MSDGSGVKCGGGAVTQIDKIPSYFTNSDTNQDKLLSHEEITNALAGDGLSDKEVIMLKQLDQAFDKISGDDGLLSIPELDAFRNPNGIVKEEGGKFVKGDKKPPAEYKTPEYWTNADRDGDGDLSRDEVTAAQNDENNDVKVRAIMGDIADHFDEMASGDDHVSEKDMLSYYAALKPFVGDKGDKEAS
ncbi:MAG: hypothetical protein KC777_01980 [Cyanobacteria bacterium HKST-UBA02]|nr:hypothetical protein [Cyanobacteria bacterium HKST-UBA02]